MANTVFFHLEQFYAIFLSLSKVTLPLLILMPLFSAKSTLGLIKRKNTRTCLLAIGLLILTTFNNNLCVGIGYIQVALFVPD